MITNQEKIAEMSRRRRNSRKLEYPDHLVTPEALMVALRRGAHALFGISHLLLEHKVEGANLSPLAMMAAICSEAELQRPATLRLSPGARMLQELFGPDSPYRMEPHFQTHIRSLCVFLSCLDRVAMNRYGEDVIRVKNKPAVK